MCPPLERQGGENQNHQELIKPGVEPELPVQGYIRSTYFQIIYSNYLFQIPSNEIVNQTLYMQLFDWDRMSKNDPLGEVKLNLGYFDLSNVKTEWRQLQKYLGKVGLIIL